MATLAADGFVVSVGQGADSRVVPEARNSAGETWQVRAADAYAAVCELGGGAAVDTADG